MRMNSVLLGILSLALLVSPAFARGGGHSGGDHSGSGHSAASRSGASHQASHSASTGAASSSRVHVNGYTKKNGTYVAPHDRTKANHDKADNWSTKGNVNPDTGKKGTKPPVR